MAATENEWTAFGVGFSAAVMLLAALTSCVPGSAIREAKIHRTACEKSLPRDQHCVMRYVPEKSP